MAFRKFLWTNNQTCNANKSKQSYNNFQYEVHAEANK